jgi:hypothetical protein
VYLEQLLGEDTPFQLLASTDGGASWHHIGLHYHGGGEEMFVGPFGSIVTFTELGPAGSSMSVELFTLDPISGYFRSLGTYQFDPGPGLGVVVDGKAHSSFIYATDVDTYVLAL